MDDQEQVAAQPDAEQSPDISPQLLQYAQSVGVGADQVAKLKQALPDATDQQLASYVMGLSKSPKAQLQTGMDREQAVNNALPTADDIKAANDPATAQKLDQFYNDPQNIADRSLKRDVAARADLYRQQAGGSPVDVQNVNQGIAEQKAGILEPVEVQQKLLDNHIKQSNDLRASYQAGLADLQNNVNMQVQFESMDPTSALSVHALEVMSQYEPSLKNAIGKVSMAQAQLLFDKDKGIATSLQNMQNQRIQALSAQRTSQAEMVKGQAAAQQAAADTTKANTEANRLQWQQGLVGNGGGSGDYTVDGSGVKLSPRAETEQKNDADTYKDAGKSRLNAMQYLHEIDDAIKLAKNTYTGPGSSVAAHIPGTNANLLNAKLNNLYVSRLSNLTSAGLSAGAEKLESLQKAVAAASGHIGQGGPALIESLERSRDAMANVLRDNMAQRKYYEKNSSFKGYTDNAPQPQYSGNGGKSSLPNGWTVKENQ